MWKKYKLSDIGAIVGGATPSTTVEKYYGGDIPWLTPKDLSSLMIGTLLEVKEISLKMD
ncbi:restriction endonuclease subunit S [Bacteroides fragilis]